MRIAARWGLILGITVCVWTLLLHVFGFYTTRLGAGQIADVLATILPVTVVACALRTQRLARGRGLRFWESARTGFGVGVVSAPISVAFLWWYHHALNPRWLELLVEWKTAALIGRGASATDVAATIDRLRSSGTVQAQIVAGLIGGIALPTAISVLMHVYFRRASHKRR